jgi:hypothetical protein
VQVDVELLKEFERGLDPAHPEQSKIPARVLGYGEISTIFEIQSDSVKDLACKRLPIFQMQDEVTRYEQIYRDYNDLLEKKIGINVPAYGFAWFALDSGRITAYDVQQKLPSACIGNRAIALLNLEDIRTLFLRVLHELCKVWIFNAANPQEALGIDGKNLQLGNFGIRSGKSSYRDGHEAALF